MKKLIQWNIIVTETLVGDGDEVNINIKCEIPVSELETDYILKITKARIDEQFRNKNYIPIIKKYAISGYIENRITYRRVQGEIFAPVIPMFCPLNTTKLYRRMLITTPFDDAVYQQQKKIEQEKYLPLVKYEDLKNIQW